MTVYCEIWTGLNSFIAVIASKYTPIGIINNQITITVIETGKYQKLN